MPYLKETVTPSKNTVGHVAWLGKALQTKQKKTSRFLWPIVIIGLCFGGAGALLQVQIHKLKKKEKRLHQAINKLKYKAITADCLGGVPIPQQLTNIPFGEDSGLVIGVKSLAIPDVDSPHNPSIIPKANGYNLFFRYDTINSKVKYIPYYSQVGVISLNQNFEREDNSFKKIPLPTNYAEDPRALWVEDELYLIFNTLNEKNVRCRHMGLANLNKDTLDVNYTTILDSNLQWIEKNWNPFAYAAEDRKPELFFEYQISPRTIFSLPTPQINSLHLLPLPSDVAYIHLPWTAKWGVIRGGTPAQKVDDEYLAFFHSAFSEKNGLYWYIMGAYTFQAKPPFAITGMSKYPILFKGIFDTPITNTAQVNKRVIFPSGYVVEKQNGRELIHVACGENDSAIKILTLDKEILLNSLNRFEH